MARTSCIKNMMECTLIVEIMYNPLLENKTCGECKHLILNLFYKRVNVHAEIISDQDEMLYM